MLIAAVDYDRESKRHRRRSRTSCADSEAALTYFVRHYWAGPKVKQPGFRVISHGGIAAVVLSIIASGAFVFHVANLGSFNKTYGALGAVLILLVWLCISNIARLLDGELSAANDRGGERR